MLNIVRIDFLFVLTDGRFGTGYVIVHPRQWGSRAGERCRPGRRGKGEDDGTFTNVD